MVKNHRPESTPRQFAETTPSPGLSADNHSWVLQSVMEMQKTLGQLTQAVYTLTDRTEKLGDKVDGKLEKLSDKIDTKADNLDIKVNGKLETFGNKLNSLSHKIYAAMAVVSVLGMIAAFLVDKGWDKIVSILFK